MAIEVLLVADVGLEVECDTELFTSRLQDVEQLLAADAGEAVAAGGDDPIADGTSMSSQCAKLAVICSKVGASAARKFSRV